MDSNSCSILTGLDLTDPALAYVFGLAQTDGSLSVEARNRGRLSFEIGRGDEEILVRIAAQLPCSSTLTRRTRDTNFKKDYESSVLRVFDRVWRERFLLWGLPMGRKSLIVRPPATPFSEVDYIRGLTDGDGSLGFTAKGFPFVSLVTSSTALADFYVDFLRRTTGRAQKRTSRNARDGVYNIAVFKEPAQIVANLLYYDGCLGMARKCAAAQGVRTWMRPAGMRRVSQRSWALDEDAFILDHSLLESMAALRRSRASIGMRLWRLGKGRSADN
jgi:hypothetical protein